MFSSNILCRTQALWLFNMERSGWFLTSLWKLEFCIVRQMKLLLSPCFEVTFCRMASDQLSTFRQPTFSESGQGNKAPLHRCPTNC